MRILIVDQCSGSKAYPSESPVFNAEEIDEASRTELLDQKQVASKQARTLYTGRQQQYIDDATSSLRSEGHDVDRYYISAGFGVVEETTPLPPYEVTFANMSSKQIQKRSELLTIHADLECLLATNTYDIVFLALGKDYYEAIDIPRLADKLNPETYLVIFNRDGLKLSHDRLVKLSARIAEAKELEVTVIALKGKMLKNFSAHLSLGEEIYNTNDISRFCTTEPTSQSDLERF